MELFPWAIFSWNTFWEMWREISSEILCCSKISWISWSQHSLAYGTDQWGRQPLMLGLQSLKTTPHFRQRSHGVPRRVTCMVPNRRPDWILVPIRRACWHSVDTARVCIPGVPPISHAAAAAQGWTVLYLNWACVQQPWRMQRQTKGW